METAAKETQNSGFAKGGQNAFKRVLNVFSYEYVIPALVIFAVYAIAQAVFDIWPFGSAIMASYDMLAQEAPFYEHYFAFLDGTSGLFHTFFAGGGMDTFGILAYCSVSPFSFIFLLGGRTNTVYLVSIVLPIKSVCVAISGIWFMKKHFPSVPKYVDGIFGVLYALSGYLYMSNTYINWVDLMMYMPFVCSGFIRLVKENKILLLSVSLSLCIYTCFSIACFSFFLIFPIGIMYFLIVTERGEKFKKAAWFSLSFVLAVAFALPILLPSLSAYLRAGRNTGMFSRIFEVKPSDATHLYQKFTYVLSDAPFIAASLFYFITAPKKDRRALFLLLSLVVLLIPCLIDESMLLLNFGSYYSYALRFGFLSGFLFFYIAAIKAEEIYLKEETVKNRRVSEILSIVLLVLSGVGIFCGILLFRYIYNGVSKGTFTSGKPFYSYFACFAHSEGGLEGVSILFGIVILLAVISFILVKFKLLSAKTAILVLSVISVFNSGFNTFAMVKGDRQGGSYQNIMNYAKIKEEIAKIDDDPYFRLKSYDYYVSSNSAIMARYYSTAQFNSMADAKNLALTSLFGYGGNGNNSSRTNKGGVFSDALFNFKYVVVKKEDLSKVKRSYLTDTEIKVDNYSVYKNTLAFPLAAVVKKSEVNFDGLNPVEKIDEIYKFFSGGESGMISVKPKFTENENGSVKISYTVPNSCDYWYWQKLPTTPEIERISGENNYELSEYSFNYQTYSESSQTRSITVRRKDGEKLYKEDLEPYFFVSALKTEKVKELTVKLEEKKVNFTLGRNKIVFPNKITAEKGEALYVGYVNIDGYRVKVNGKRREFIRNDANLMVVELDEGENEVEITYRSPYIKFILLGVLAAALISMSIWLLMRKSIIQKLEKPLAIAALGLSILLIGFFLLFPTGLFVYKLIVPIV